MVATVGVGVGATATVGAGVGAGVGVTRGGAVGVGARVAATGAVVTGVDGGGGGAVGGGAVGTAGAAAIGAGATTAGAGAGVVMAIAATANPKLPTAAPVARMRPAAAGRRRDAIQSSSPRGSASWLGAGGLATDGRAAVEVVVGRAGRDRVGVTTGSDAVTGPSDAGISSTSTTGGSATLGVLGSADRADAPHARARLCDVEDAGGGTDGGGDAGGADRQGGDGGEGTTAVHGSSSGIGSW